MAPLHLGGQVPWLQTAASTLAGLCREGIHEKISGDSGTHKRVGVLGLEAILPPH